MLPNLSGKSFLFLFVVLQDDGELCNMPPTHTPDSCAVKYTMHCCVQSELHGPSHLRVDLFHSHSPKEVPVALHIVGGIEALLATNKASKNAGQLEEAPVVDKGIACTCTYNTHKQHSSVTKLSTNNI
jgi:hypothetical protein